MVSILSDIFGIWRNSSQRDDDERSGDHLVRTIIDENESLTDSLPLGCTFAEYHIIEEARDTHGFDTVQLQLNANQEQSAETGRHDVVMWEQLRDHPGALVGKLRNRSGATERRMLNVALHKAMDRVQAQWRGQLARKTGVARAAHVYIQELCESISAEMSARQLNKALVYRVNALAVKEDSHWFWWLSSFARQGVADDPAHRGRAATLIQSWYRGCWSRRLCRRAQMCNDKCQAAASSIEA
eukprot:gnl/TRDRNA2_/TRDRNA2_60416_c0_seq1.p1 gnl/TRDRNA2_/TRDRNA2_60416_c0~~gnl/TRDRNA2_/TRDRNA2_60416_c0_seq1.p1  ORF type:complete len:242 (-),score=34.53 gnl/TRDRNA2_/TRDRNA2_60416_c0_seq1:123-848(-)